MFALGPDNPMSPPTSVSRLSDTISGGYTLIPEQYYHPKPTRNALGLFAGNDVSPASGNLVDLESELRNITRDLSNAPANKFTPTCVLGSGPQLRKPLIAPWSTEGDCQPARTLYFTERSTGQLKTINTVPRHLPTTQYVSYPGVPRPEPMTVEVHGTPWRF